MYFKTAFKSVNIFTHLTTHKNQLTLILKKKKNLNSHSKTSRIINQIYIITFKVTTIMSSTTYFLSRLTNISQTTLSRPTREKFITSSIIQSEPNNEGFDDLLLLDSKNLKIDFPNCIFNKIPSNVNTQAFLQYLGLKDDSARQVFNDAIQRTHGILDGEALYNQIKGLALEYPSNKSSFKDDVISDLNRLIHSASQTPGKMNDYITRVKPGSSFSDLKESDYLVEIFFQRIANLRCLDRAITKYLAEGA